MTVYVLQHWPNGFPMDVAPEIYAIYSTLDVAVKQAGEFAAAAGRPDIVAIEAWEVDKPESGIVLR